MADDSRSHIDGLFADFSGHVGDLDSPESYVGTFQRENLLFAGPAPGRYGTVRCTEDSVLKKVAPVADRLAVVHNATISRFSRAFFFRDTNEPLLGNHLDDFRATDVACFGQDSKKRNHSVEGAPGRRSITAATIHGRRRHSFAGTPVCLLAAGERRARRRERTQRL